MDIKTRIRLLDEAENLILQIGKAAIAGDNRLLLIDTFILQNRIGRARINALEHDPDLYGGGPTRPGSPWARGGDG